MHVWCVLTLIDALNNCGASLNSERTTRSLATKAVVPQAQLTVTLWTLPFGPPRRTRWPCSTASRCEVALLSRIDQLLGARHVALLVRSTCLRRRTNREKRKQH